MTESTARNDTFISVGKVDEFLENRGKRVSVNGRGVAVFRIKGRFFALRDSCTHAAARLSGGAVKGGCVACPRHGARFDLETGMPTTLQAVRNVEVFEVKVADGEVLVNAEGTVAEPAWVTGQRLDQWRGADRIESLIEAGSFPVIESQRAKGRAYLDSASTTQKPLAVIEAVRAFYAERNANVHRGIHQLSEEATAAYEAVRQALGEFIGAAHPAEEIIFCRGATEAINLVAHSWGDGNINEGDEIVVTTMEHHSNLVPWQLLCRRTGARLVELEPDVMGSLTEEAIRGAVGPRTRLVAVTHVSNLLGTINDIELVAAIAHEAGALVLVDGAQALGHLPVDVGALGCDLYVGSGHKMFGPTGTGFLHGSRNLLRTFEPFLGGGEMIDEVFIDHSTYAPLPARLEAGTPNIAGVIGLGAALSFLGTVGMDRVRAHDVALVDRAMERLLAIPWIEIYGPRQSAGRSGLISFNIEGLHAHDVGSVLDARGVAVRAGHLCAQPMLRHLGRSSCVRASFGLYNDERDIELLVQALEETARLFGVTHRLFGISG